MPRTIEHLVEPQRLLLFWQARESENRSRYQVGELISQDGKVSLRYDTGNEIEAAKKAGFKGYPAFSLKQAEHDHQVLEAFQRRLPPRNRRDFSRYLELRAISPEAKISDFALLGYSGAKLPDDGFELVHPFDNPPEAFEVLLEIAGFRHEATVSHEALQPGYDIQFEPEPENLHDSKAIRIESSGRKLGYVPRSQLDMMHRMLEQDASISGEIFRINGTVSRPLVYVLVSVVHEKGLHHNEVERQAQG